MTDEKQAVYDELQRMADDERLTPRAVVDAARSETSILHSYFEWNDAIAADQQRLNQARRLISGVNITIVRENREFRVNAFVESPSKPEGQQGYIAFESLMDDAELARQFMQRELALADAHVQKTTDFAAVLGVGKKVAGLLRDISKLRHRLSSGSEARP